MNYSCCPKGRATDGLSAEPPQHSHDREQAQQIDPRTKIL
jgi:hypothetical protein